MNDQENSQVAELIAGEVLGDLSQEERSELNRLKAFSPHEQHDALSHELEVAAASLQRAGASTKMGIPAALAESIRAAGYMAIRDLPPPASTRSDQPTVITLETTTTRREKMAWACVAALALICASMGVSLILNQGSDPNKKAVANVLETPIEKHRRLSNIASATQATWGEGKTPFENQVSGDVIWDSESQTGVMRFVDMPINNPTQQQYQLWIIDPERDDEPVDGGVFDIAQDGEVFIEIDPKLNVIRPTAFAITIEKPGGVVVSTQEQLPLLAAVQ